jgi:hypothetical protein
MGRQVWEKLHSDGDETICRNQAKPKPAPPKLR